MDFCFSEVAHAFQFCFQAPNGQEVVTRKLLEWVTMLPGITNSRGNQIQIIPSLASDLFTRTANVPTAIKDECGSLRFKEGLMKNLKEVVIPYLDPNLADEIYDRLLKLVTSGSGIMPSSSEKLKELLANNQKLEFLAGVIMLAIVYQNVKENEVEICDYPLVEEQNNKCPLSGKKLVVNYQGRALCKYVRVSIYPKDISLANDDFSSVAKPMNLDDSYNQILLSEDEARQYTTVPTLAIYSKLRNAKDEILRFAQLRNNLSLIPLDKEINQIIEGLANNTNFTEMVPLNMKANLVSAKIKENKVLEEEVLHFVLSHFNYVQSLFSAVDDVCSGYSGLIGSEIKVAYLSLHSRNLSQSAIIDELATWIKTNSSVPNASAMSYRIIVYYFIQHCEVFDASAQ